MSPAGKGHYRKATGDPMTTENNRYQPSGAAAVARLDAATCTCGTYHYGEYGQGWLRNWCANQCCWTEETCRSCGARYVAKTGERACLSPR